MGAVVKFGCIWSCLWLYGFALMPAQNQTLSELLQQPAFDSLSAIPPSDQVLADNEGNIILLSALQQKVYKYLIINQYDSAISIGGIGSREEGLAHPRKMVVKNRQNLYVLDDIQMRILLLNTNFKIIRTLDFLDLGTSDDTFDVGNEVEIIPISFELSQTGEIFVLNQLDNKCYKFNAFGELETAFGGIDFGEGSLYAPADIQVSPDNQIWISDTNSYELRVYDYFGTFQYNWKPQTEFRWKQFRFLGSYLACMDEHTIYLEDPRSHRYELITIPLKEKVLDIHAGKEYIYLLLENAVHLYKI